MPRRIASLACAFAVSAAAAAESPLSRFTLGRMDVVLNVSGDNVAPGVTVSNRFVRLCSSVWGYLSEDRREIRFRSRKTADFRTERLERGFRVSYDRVLVTGPATNETVVGTAHTVLVFSENAVHGEITAAPAEPGRYRYAGAEPFLACNNLPIEPWVGCEALTVDAKGRLRTTRFPEKEAFTRASWGLNTGRDGVKTLELGFADSVTRFIAGRSSDFRINHYGSGFQCDAAFVNPDLMHPPTWSKAVAWTFDLRFE